MFLLALAASILCPPAFAKPKLLAVPGLGLEVTIPEVPEDASGVKPENPWGHTLGDASMEVRLGLRNTELYTDVTFSGTSWQPELDQIKDLPELVLPSDDDDLGITVTDTRVEEWPVVGEVHLVSADVRDTWMEQDLWTRVAVFPVKGAGVRVSATSSESPERADEVLKMVLTEMLTVNEPPVPVAELPKGKIDLEAGYGLTLPAGWRALTVDETRKLDSARVGGETEYSGAMAKLFVVDTAALTEDVFRCMVDSTGTLEILAPEKSPRAVDNFKAYARVHLKGGRYRLLNGVEEAFIDVFSDIPVVPSEEGPVEHVTLGEREGYLWKVKGEVYGEPVSAAVFYTAYGPLGLTCIAVADEGEEARINTFAQTMQSVHVLSPEAYPMPLSVRARYIRWWPSTNPFFQLYWLPLPLFLIAGWLVVKD